MPHGTRAPAERSLRVRQAWQRNVHASSVLAEAAEVRRTSNRQGTFRLSVSLVTRSPGDGMSQPNGGFTPKGGVCRSRARTANQRTTNARNGTKEAGARSPLQKGEEPLRRNLLPSPFALPPSHAAASASVAERLVAETKRTANVVRQAGRGSRSPCAPRAAATSSRLPNAHQSPYRWRRGESAAGMRSHQPQRSDAIR